MIEAARLAYEAYSRCVVAQAKDKTPKPSWDLLSELARDRWRAAVAAVFDQRCPTCRIGMVTTKENE